MDSNNIIIECDFADLQEENGECPSSNFSFNITYLGLKFSFNSEVCSVYFEELKNFLNNFRDHNDCSISFNKLNGSLISYKNNILIFYVYTYKEGAFSTIDIKIKLNENKHSEMLENFNKLLEFRENYEAKLDEYYDKYYGEDDDISYNEEISPQEGNPEDNSDAEDDNDNGEDDNDNGEDDNDNGEDD